MCGIAGIINLKNEEYPNIQQHLKIMGDLIEHRGPDADGVWLSRSFDVGFAHKRLSIIDLDPKSNQPMIAQSGNVVAFNGEVYNYIELADELKNSWEFTTKSDTETILASYEKYREESVKKLRGMFAFALYDKKNNSIFCARDRFGIKPFYYLIKNNNFYFASEAKALIPFLDEIKTNAKAFSEYLTFQYPIGEHTLFDGIKQLMPGHYLKIKNGVVEIQKYWDVTYDVDFNMDQEYALEKVSHLVSDSMKVHLRSDVEVGSYVSGGVDSSLLLNLASSSNKNIKGFHGRFTDYEGYDESRYAADAVKHSSGELFLRDITPDDFINNIEKVIYHLDFPIAGPGSFPQYMVSELASQNLKVCFGGQGGDEIFGGYARYLIAYLEQCLKGAINGNYKNGNYVVTIESIIPNLGLLKEYIPLMKSFWSQGLFEPMDKRYFRLVNKSLDIADEVDHAELKLAEVESDFSKIFNDSNYVQDDAYFDKMTRFDFKSLLPALLQVEDRMSMAHGLESRVPFLDHSLIEFVATIPANIKFKDGQMKYILKEIFRNNLPNTILNRRDKMGFPVPIKEWFEKDVKAFVTEVLLKGKSNERPYLKKDKILSSFGKDARFSRKSWALLTLEIWHQTFHDKHNVYKKMLK